MNVAMVGDVMLGRMVNELLKERVPDYPWGDALPLLLGADLRVCNLECVVSDDGEPWEPSTKPFHFRSDARNVDVLLAAKIDAVSLANNHVLDFGYDALLDMLKILDRAGIAHAGAGSNLKEAQKAIGLDAGGVGVGIIAFTDNEPEWAARSEKPGTFYTPLDLGDARARNLLALVRQTRKDVDLLILSAHWGSNWGHVPPQQHIAFAHALVGAGADVVFGHSSHVFRGIELYLSRPIIYGAGDFVDDYAVDPIERNDESFVFMLKTKDATMGGLRMFPSRIELCQAGLGSLAMRRATGEKMRSLCADLGTTASWGKGHSYLEVRIPKFKGKRPATSPWSKLGAVVSPADVRRRRRRKLIEDLARDLDPASREAVIEIYDNWTGEESERELSRLLGKRAAKRFLDAATSGRDDESSS